MKIFLSLLLCLSSCNLFQEAGEVPPSGEQYLNLNIGEEPGTLDPALLSGTSSRLVVRMVNEGLTRISPEGEPEPALAAKIDRSGDGITYLITLRDAKWSNGETVTSRDFIFAWQRLLDPENTSAHAEELFLIENAKEVKAGLRPLEELAVYAPDDKTLVVTLGAPVPFFLEALANPEFFPVPSKAVQENPDWASEAATYVSCGPFQLTSWRHNSQIILEKNPTYWDEAHVTLEKITLHMVSDTTALEMFEAGTLDWAGGPFGELPYAAIPALRESKKLHIQLLNSTYLYVFNTERNPTANENFRHALNLAIDRREIVEDILQLGEPSAYALVPSIMKDLPQIYYSDHAMQRARKLFQQALSDLDIRRSELPTLTISTGHDETHLKIAEAIQKQWKDAFRIHVEVQQESHESYLEKVKAGEFYVGRMTYVAAVNDPTEFLKRLGDPTSSFNLTKWDSPLYVEMIERAQQTLDLKQRSRILRMTEDLLMEQLPIAPLYHPMLSYVKADNLHGVVVNQLGQAEFKKAYRSR